MLRAAAVAVAVAVGAPVWAPAGAQVQPRGFYLGGHGTLTFPDTVRLTDDVLSPGEDQTLRLESDYGFGGAFGFAFGNGLRIEGESTLRVLDMDRFSGRALGLRDPIGAVDGDVTVLPLMLNVLYDQDLGLSADGLPLGAYIGLGLGYAHLEMDNADRGLDFSDNLYAYQFMAGLRLRVAPRVYLNTGYKFFATQNAQLGDTEFRYRTHNIELGMVWQFGEFVGAAAAPAPARRPESVVMRPRGLYAEMFGTANAVNTADVDDPAAPGGKGMLDYLSKRQGFFDKRAGFGAALGYAFGGGWRSEAEVVYRKLAHHRLDGGGFGVRGDRDNFAGYTRLVSLSANGYYDADIGLVVQGVPILPYLGAGIGITSVAIESDAIGLDDSDGVFSYQVMLGARFRLREHLYARLGYRHFRTTEAEIATSRINLAVHDVTFGVGWQF